MSVMSDAATAVDIALAKWQEVGLADLQRDTLDSAGMAIISNQELSEKSRKKLVEMTREFRKTVLDEDTRKTFAPILKGYQSEVDALSRRSKVAETAFLTIYKQLSDAPDPVPLLRQAAEDMESFRNMAAMTEENRKLKQSIKECKEEMKQVKNQDVTINRLQASIAELERSDVKRVDELLAAERINLHMVAETHTRDLQRQSAKLTIQLEEAEASKASMHSALEVAQNQLLEAKSHFEEELDAKSSETEMLLLEMDRLKERLHDRDMLEIELASLREAVNESSSIIDGVPGKRSSKYTNGVTGESTTIKRLEDELGDKEREVAHLVDSVQGLHVSLANAERKHTNTTRSLEALLSDASARVESLQSTLDRQSDYRELKRELAVLKSAAFGLNVGDPSFDENGPDSDPDNGKMGECSGSGYDGIQNQERYRNKKQVKSLELLLLEKNRLLQSENTATKLELTEKTDLLADTDRRLREVSETIEKRDILICRLENDLQGLSCSSIGDYGIGAVASKSLIVDTTSNDTTSNDVVSDLLRKTSSVFATATPMSGPASSASSETLMPKSTSDVNSIRGSESVLDIVSGQRDRFRKRALELEAADIHRQQVAVNLQHEIDSLRNDNVKLYEKIKFLQSYDCGKGNASAGTHSAGDDEEALSRYRPHYEENLNPFNSFNKKERQRHYNSLNSVERAMLSLARFSMSNKTARFALFVYLVGLHILVFAVLTKLSYMDNMVCDLVGERVEDE